MVSVAAALAAPLAGVAQGAAAPAGPPGPPPGAGTGLPLPPPPGQAPGPAASLGATALPAAISGPGVLTGFVTLSGSSVSVKLACAAAGSATLRSAGGSAKTTYRCKKGRATAKFTLTKSQAANIPRLGGITAALTVVEKGKTEHLSVSVSKILPAPSYWTSNFGLSCAAEGSNVAQLVAPNFSASLPTTIDVRPWLAWYTPATGWQWLGSRGPGNSSWYRWTATPSGVAEWQQNGTINPWTWAPISVAPGHNTYLVAVFEAVYWYGNPAYVWNYAHSQPGSLTTDCVYP